MTAQFADYISTEVPTTRILSSIQYKNFPTNTYHGVIFYVTLVGSFPSLIEYMPKFKLRVTLLDDDFNKRPQYQILSPKMREIPYVSSYLTLDDKRIEVEKPLDKAFEMPVKSIEGMLYFEIPKTPTQVLACAYVDI
jgi:hypothetical protein